jgi:hypothetical protein
MIQQGQISLRQNNQFLCFQVDKPCFDLIMVYHRYSVDAALLGFVRVPSKSSSQKSHRLSFCLLYAFVFAPVLRFPYKFVFKASYKVLSILTVKWLCLTACLQNSKFASRLTISLLLKICSGCFTFLVRFIEDVSKFSR